MKDEERREYEALREIQTKSRTLRNGRILKMMVDEVRVPNGRSAARELVRHLGAVCVAPVTADGRIILERQYRYVIDRVITEVPAGKLDYAGEDPLSAAKRELREETGYEAGEWIFLGDFYPAAAYSDERIRMYLARDLHAGERHLDEDEFINVFTLPLAEAVDAVMRGGIPDAKTQTAILKAARFLEEERAAAEKKG